VSRRIPLVRPPRLVGGSVASAFGDSGAPGLPQPGSLEATDLAISYANDERGRWTERVFEFPQFLALAPGGASVAAAVNTQSIQVTGNRTDFVRLVAARGVLQNSTVVPLSGLETANLLLRLQINGEEDFTTSGPNISSPSSFAMLFANAAAPWFWYAAPPRLRIGEIVLATVTNNLALGGATLTPEVALRFVDDEWWRELYGT